jgi:hypothetical protein
LTWEIYENEILPYWLYITKGYGFSVDDIGWSCPKDLEPYAKAHNEEYKENDYLMHTMGLYCNIAFEVVMAQFGAGLSGKKSKAKYIEKPFHELQREANHEYTEDEIIAKRQGFVDRMVKMKERWDESH